MTNPGGSSHRGIGLSNTIHSEVAPCLPLPSLPTFCGAVEQELRLFDERRSSRSLDRNDVLAQASKITDLLRDTDISYLNLRRDKDNLPYSFPETSDLYNKVLQYDSKHLCTLFQDISTSVPLRTPKFKKKGTDGVSSSARPDPVEVQDAIVGGFCEVLEDFCSRAEIPAEDRDEALWLSVPLSDLKMLVNEIVSIREKKMLQLVPVDILARLLNVLDHQIHRAEGLSFENENSDTDIFSTLFCALEAAHAALAVLAHHGMPKQLYKEEIIDRILEVSRHQIMECMSARDPSYRALHRPSENGAPDEEEDEEAEDELGSASKKRRSSRSVKTKKATGNRGSSTVNAVLQKLCTVLGFLKELLLIERLSDSSILQLVKTSFTTFLVDNIQLLQLKAISLICGVFSSYGQHKNFVIDEILQVLWKLPFSKRALRTYHLPDEEQRQIQMITALLIQLVHCSAKLPEALRQNLTGHSILEASIDDSYPSKCHEASKEACCLFWTPVLQRLTTGKGQEASELKVITENLVLDLLTTLNLPEYPASAPILEVLCILLLQNAGLKCKDISARSMAIDILGIIAARLKRDAVFCKRDKFWILQELLSEDGNVQSHPKDVCSICFDGRGGKMLFICHGCQRLFHADCMGVREHEVPTRTWHCQFCLCKKQLIVLESYCKSQYADDVINNQIATEKASEASDSITKLEIVRQMLLNYLQEAGAVDDEHLFARWFYLCMWYKDDPKCQEKFIYYLARIKSKFIVREPWTISSLLTRASAKKISSALGQNTSFSRGFDKILHMLLASLRENSPIIRAKALRAVSLIVEADPDVLCEDRVQSAVEGRFSDSAISVREAALELVGRHIASHPDVGLKYFGKVAERITDTGVSVRKRAIKIIRDMCSSSANFSEFTSACIAIISRVNDEESSIQDLVCKTFYEFWFEEPSGSQAQFFGDNSSVPLEVAHKTEQIVGMLRKMPNQQLLVTVIRRNLALDFFPQSAKAAGINPLSLATVRRRCELMCKCLLERMLQVEEMNSEEVEVRALPYVMVLHAFCVVDPTLCAPASDPSQFVVTLQPYLKIQVDNRVVAQLLESIIFIIDAVLPLMRKPPQTVVEELEQDLKNMIVRHSFLTVVHACIKCLCSLSKLAGKGATLVEHLVQVFFKHLDAARLDNKQQVGRSLFCLGLLIRYGNSLMVTSDKKNIDIIRSLSLLKKFLDLDDFVMKVRSLQALGFVLIARPEYMLEEDIGKVLEATLSSGSDAQLKMQALQNLYEYLLDAESQMGTEKTGNCVAPCPVVGSVPVAAGAGDTNICGGIIQLYWDSVLERCLDVNDEVRHSALKIVEVVLRQGLVHPITCVPYLIALETDPQEVNLKLAHHLLMNMNEKYPSFFESRLGDGLQMSFNFMQSITNIFTQYSNPNKLTGNMKGRSDSSSFNYARLGVSRIYKLIRGNRFSRNKFMSSVVRKFDSPSWSHSLIPFLKYCTEILASLPFTLPDEPLYLIYNINRVIQVRAGVLEANMKALSLHCTKGDAHNVTYENGIYQQEPVPQPTSEDTKMHSTTSNDFCVNSKDDLQKIQADCLAATALQLLLKLKRHLKIVYSLNDARCQAFAPHEPLKPGEVLSRQNIPFNIGEVRINLPSSYMEINERYQEFKAALKEDTIDYSIYTANIKRKRPVRNSRGGRSGREAWGDDEDDDADEDWTGGTRRLSYGSRKSNSSRRQRL